MTTVAHCNEMADLMFAELYGKAELRDKVLEIYFKESTGMTHVVVLYAEHPELLNKFGDVSSSDLAAPAILPKIDKDDFIQWLFDNRKEVLLIDPWGKKKILDFSDMVRIEGIRSDMNDFVRGADFTDVLQRYTVQALVPQKRRLSAP